MLPPCCTAQPSHSMATQYSSKGLVQRTGFTDFEATYVGFFSFPSIHLSFVCKTQLEAEKQNLSYLFCPSPFGKWWSYSPWESFLIELEIIWAFLFASLFYVPVLLMGVSAMGFGGLLVIPLLALQ